MTAVALALVLGAAQDEIFLGVGVQKSVDVGEYARFSVTPQKKVAEVVPAGERTVIVIGNAEGRATLKVWLKDGRQRSWRIIVRDRLL